MYLLIFLLVPFAIEMPQDWLTSMFVTLEMALQAKCMLVLLSVLS
jgi:hypothetical protein